MKTIEEAAKEYGIKEADDFPHYSIRAEMTKLEIAEWFYDAHKAGIKFAERWIHVEEELPENDDFVLIKDTTGLHEVGYYDSEYKLWVKPSSSLMIHKNISHWRPINHK